MAKEKKTNAVRVLEAANIDFSFHQYSGEKEVKSGEEVAQLLGLPPSVIYKTLVTVGKENHYVFIIPADEHLNVKRAAAAVGEKKVEMIPMKDLFQVTGYVRGGCSPLAMKNDFPKVIHEDAILHDWIYISAGRIGAQIRIHPEDLITMGSMTVEDISDKKE